MHSGRDERDSRLHSSDRHISIYGEPAAWNSLQLSPLPGFSQFFLFESSSYFQLNHRQMPFEPQVIIVGAGPCGCLLALRLIRQGIRVALLEQEEEIQPHFRALGYPGSTHAALQKAGIWEDANEKGFIKRGFSWRKLPQDNGANEKDKFWGDLIATWDAYANSPLKEGDIGYGMLALPQNRFREIILPKVLSSELAKVFLGHTVVDLRQGSRSATVTATDSAGSQIQLTASFVVGADGGKSLVRRQLGVHLNGFTWDQIIVAVDMLIDLPPPKDGPSSMYYVHPVDFAFLSLIEKPRETGANLWRCTLAMTEDESKPDVFDASLRRKLEKLMPGTRPLEYQLLRSQPYRIHQRSAETMHDGRCLLVGDAAHLTNVRLLTLSRSRDEIRFTNILVYCSLGGALA